MPRSRRARAPRRARASPSPDEVPLVHEQRARARRARARGRARARPGRVKPSLASISTSATSARSIARTAISALPRSAEPVAAPGPAEARGVDEHEALARRCSSVTSIASRVVPGIVRDHDALLADQPVQRASSCRRSGARRARCGAARRAPAGAAGAALGGSAATSSSSRSQAPLPCSAETPRTRAKPSAWNSATRGACCGASILLTHSASGFFVRRSVRASSLVLGQHAGAGRPPRTGSRRRARSRRAPAPAPPRRRRVRRRGRGRPCRRAARGASPTSISSAMRSRVMPGRIVDQRAPVAGEAVEERRLARRSGGRRSRRWGAARRTWRHPRPGGGRPGDRRRAEVTVATAARNAARRASLLDNRARARLGWPRRAEAGGPRIAPAARRPLEVKARDAARPDRARLQTAFALGAARPALAGRPARRTDVLKRSVSRTSPAPSTWRFRRYVAGKTIYTQHATTRRHAGVRIAYIDPGLRLEHEVQIGGGVTPRRSPA